MSDRWQRVRSIVEAALDRPVAARDRFVREASAGDHSLETEVRELIAAAEDASDIGRAIEGGAVAPPPEPPRALEPGSFIGRYRLVRYIGGGGMGAVWQAEQLDPQRTVALKVLPHAIATDEDVARFRFEAAVLARLKHPHVAVLFEAGTFDAGRPFFAMEFVEGARSIARFVADEKLSVRARIELLLHVCDAVEHGHQRGVIHRDLKSANVLVDAHGSPKVIDFGIARATDRRDAWSASNPHFTRTGQVIGTVATMAPEQVENARDLVDVRTDVYALGVILCEILTGELPLDFTGLSLIESAKRIRNDAPVLPSVRDPSLPKELDWIAGRALAKEKERRYPTVSEFAADLRRFVSGAAVLAAPDSMMYRARVFTRRYRVAIAVALVVVAALVTVVVTSMLARAKEAAARKRAEASLAFLNTMLSSARPERAGKDVRVRDVLDTAEQDLARGFDGPPDVEAVVRGTLGISWLSLDLIERAEPQLVRSFELRRELLGPDDPETLETEHELANLRRRQGRLREADEMFTDVIERSTRVLGAADTATLLAHSSHSYVLTGLGRFAEAESECRAALALIPADLADYNERRHDIETALINALSNSGGRAECAELARSSYERDLKALGPNNIRTLVSAGELGRQLVLSGAVDDGIALMRRTFEERQRLLGPEHDWTLLARETLIACERAAGRFENCVQDMRDVIAIRVKREGPASSRALDDISILGSTLRQLGRFPEALEVLKKARDESRAVNGPDDLSTLTLDTSIAQTLVDSGDVDAAIPELRAALASPTVIADPAGFRALALKETLALALRDPDHADESAQLFHEVLDAHRNRLGDDAVDTLRTMVHLSGVEQLRGDLAAAESLAATALAGLQARLGNDSVETLNANITLATIYDSCGRFADARPHAAAALAAAGRLFGEDHPTWGDIAGELGMAKLRLGEVAEAEELLARSGALRAKFYGRDNRFTRLANLEDAAALILLGRIEDAARAAQFARDEGGFNRIARALIAAPGGPPTPDLSSASADAREFAAGVAEGFEREKNVSAARAWRAAAGR